MAIAIAKELITIRVLSILAKRLMPPRGLAATRFTSVSQFSAHCTVSDLHTLGMTMASGPAL
jgi:hypothetical protein